MTPSADKSNANPEIAVIGGGPAGLMAAETLANLGWSVDVYDGMPSVGRKFLLAGVGGMNITHSEPVDPFLQRYGQQREFVAPWLRAFGSDRLQQWVHDLGIETFTGSSGRVFPREMKAAPLLRAWLLRLRRSGVRIHSRHRWLGWGQDGALLFQAGERGSNGTRTISIQARAVVLALGGASWSRLGSDGEWAPLLRAKGVAVSPLKPANCGFEVNWTPHFKERFAGQPLKSIRIRHCSGAGKAQWLQGECMVSREGLEGGVVYTLSASLREALYRDGSARIELDMAPDQSLEQLCRAMAKPRGGMSMANHLRRRARIEGVKASLLREVAEPEHWQAPEQLAALIKALPLTLTGIRPLDEAISTAGGIAAGALDEQLMLKALPGVFCAGEMLDWEAPTGGYLLSACFASGQAAGRGADRWLKRNPSGNPSDNSSNSAARSR